MEQSFQRLNLDYIDLVMIHSPGIPEGYPYLDPEIMKTLPKTPEEYQVA